MNLETKAVTTLIDGLRQLPAVVAARRSDHVLAPAEQGDYEIYTIKPDGTGDEAADLRAAATTRTRAGRPTASTSSSLQSRMGFKDEVIYTDAPQPYGELFVMRYDGTDVQQLTDNQWEDGTPAWQPSRPPAATRDRARRDQAEFGIRNSESRIQF